MTRSSHTDAKEMISDIERLTPDLCAIGDDNFRYRTVSPKSPGPHTFRPQTGISYPLSPSASSEDMNFSHKHPGPAMATIATP